MEKINKCTSFFADAQTHGSTKLVLYFAVMGYCLISRTEKLMVRNVFPSMAWITDKSNNLYYTEY